MKPSLTVAALFNEAGHGLDQQATVDRVDWLREEVGLDAGP
jgi:hypothetical protein